MTAARPPARTEAGSISPNCKTIPILRRKSYCQADSLRGGRDCGSAVSHRLPRFTAYYIYNLPRSTILCTLCDISSVREVVFLEVPLVICFAWQHISVLSANRPEELTRTLLTKHWN